MSGPPDARTDPETGLRWYEWEGEEYISVTSLRRVIGMPFALANWQVGQVIEAAIENSTELHMARVSPEWRDPKYQARIRSGLRAKAMENRDRAAGVGTTVHEATEKGLDPKTIADPVIAAMVTQYEDAVRSLGLTRVLTERQVWSREHRYAGTLDRVYRMGERLVLCDVKTGKGLYVEHAVQLMAYALADWVGEGGRVDDSATRVLHAVQVLAILHVRPEGWEWLEVRPSPKVRQALEAMVSLARFLSSNESLDPFIIDRRKGAA